MRHTTEQLYGISPQELRALTYEEALYACERGTNKRLRELMQPAFYDRDETLILAVRKAQHWSEAKINELDDIRFTRFKLFIIHIKYAFKALFRSKV